MTPGEEYLIGDGLGYDVVVCLGQSFDKDIGMNVVKVRFVETGREDILYESGDCGFMTYVEPR